MVILNFIAKVTANGLQRSFPVALLAFPLEHRLNLGVYIGELLHRISVECHRELTR